MAKKSEMPVNADLLKWARESIGLDLPTAAKKLAFEISKLEFLESGKELPSYAQLKKIANVYKRSTAVFFLSERPIEPAPPKDFRVLFGKATPKLDPSTYVAIRSVRLKRENAIALLQDEDKEPPKFRFTTNLEADPGAVAATWRKRLDVPLDIKFQDDYHAFRVWKTAVEIAGVLVFQESLKSIEELRGLAIYSETLPAIMLNTKDSVRGRMFSLMHEFCHILLKKSGIGSMSLNDRSKSAESTIEVFCNAFAGAILVPGDQLLSDAAVRVSSKSKPVSVNDIVRLSNRFQSSQEVILRRLLTFDKITGQTYQDAKDRIEEFFAAKKKGKKSKVIIPVPRKAIARNGKPYTELVLRGIRLGNLTEARGSQYLGVKHQHLPEIRKILAGYQGD